MTVRPKTMELKGDTARTKALSPCVGVCKIDRSKRWCIGCGRTASEIARWAGMSETEQLKLLGKLDRRIASERLMSRKKPTLL